MFQLSSCSPLEGGGKRGQAGLAGFWKPFSELICHFCGSQIKAETKPNATHGQFHFSEEGKKQKEKDYNQVCVYTPGHCLKVKGLLQPKSSALESSQSHIYISILKKLDKLLRDSQM